MLELADKERRLAEIDRRLAEFDVRAGEARRTPRPRSPQSAAQAETLQRARRTASRSRQSGCSSTPSSRPQQAVDRLAADLREREARQAVAEADLERREARLDRRQDTLDERERDVDDRNDALELRDVQIKEREADVARLTVRADGSRPSSTPSATALADAEEAVARERAVIQRRMAEIEKRESAERTDLDEAVRSRQQRRAAAARACSGATAASPSRSSTTRSGRRRPSFSHRSVG